MMSSVIDEISSRRTVLLLGSCEYELIGFESLLAEYDFIVKRASGLDDNLPLRFDMVVIALSSEPLLRWGRFVSIIEKLYEIFPARLIIFVPEKICNLKLLTRIALVFNGRSQITDLRQSITLFAKNTPRSPTNFKVLSTIQRRELVRLKLIANGKIKNRIKQSKVTYYHRARIIKTIGIDNLHVLFVVGLLLEDTSDL
ncbi:TPA: hypothetical protein JZG30_004466 [Escherichia coli]|nr:hypothetical protein [Escherichia coli]